jgi:hypothetical protein
MKTAKEIRMTTEYSVDEIKGYIEEGNNRIKTIRLGQLRLKAHIWLLEGKINFGKYEYFSLKIDKLQQKLRTR